MKIAVAMSGGVDSSTVAYLLKQEGHEIFGMYMVNWDEKNPEGRCAGEQDAEDVAAVCDHLGIPFYTVNFTEEYWDQVFTGFLEEIKAGYTPNPDVLCNREIKFKVLFEKALSLGADCLATGHYCQTDGTHLLRGKDPGKDQSYFLYAINGSVLKKILFPLGNLLKSEVRAIAREAGLPVAAKRDSTGICFIGKRQFRPFLEKYIPNKEGPIETVEGKPMGTHQGIAYYTIGQRKGMGVGGPGDAYYVAGKDRARNALLIAQGADHPALFKKSLTASELTWIGAPPPNRCTAKIRYRQEDTPCTIEIEEGKLRVEFDSLQRAVTPRQSIVLYDGPRCIGGGLIN